MKNSVVSAASFEEFAVAWLQIIHISSAYIRHGN